MSDQVDTFQFFIPGEPRAKGSARAAIFGKRASIYQAEADRSYLEDGKVLCRQNRPPYFEGPVLVEISAWRSVPQSRSKKEKAAIQDGKVMPTPKPDVDNYVKMALDICSKIVFKDDAQVTDLIAKKRYLRAGHGPPVPGMQIKISRL